MSDKYNRVNISMSDEDIRNIDAYCNAHNLTRSKFMVQCALDKIQVEQVANCLSLISAYLSKTDIDGVLSDDDKMVLHYAVNLVNSTIDEKQVS